MARTNGGLIGKRNVTSFGKCTVTTFTSNGNICTQAGTRVVHAKILAGGAGGNTGNVSNGGGGGGAGGYICEQITVCGSTQYAMVVGGGGAGASHPQSPPLENPGSYGSAGSNSTGFGKTATGAPTHIADAPGPSNRVRQVVLQVPLNPMLVEVHPIEVVEVEVELEVLEVILQEIVLVVLVVLVGQVQLIVPLHGGGGGGGSWEAGSGAGAGAAGPGGGGAGGAGTANPGANADTNKGGGGGGGAGDCGISGSTSGGGNGGSGRVIVKELNKASGVWNLRSQFSKISQGLWPDGSKVLGVDLDYLIVAGGGGAGSNPGQGGTAGAGAGGYRATGYGPSPLTRISVRV